MSISRAHAWRKEQSRLQVLQEDIRTLKANLNVMLDASNLHDMTKIRLDIEAISAVTFESSQQQMALGNNFLSGLAAVDQRIARVEKMLLTHLALNGNIDGLKYLFSKGLASPRDVSTTRGYSVLRWALYGKQYETCEFLIHAGADTDYRPISASDNSPRNKACHFLLKGGLSDTAVGALRIIAKNSYLEDFIDEARFTKTHLGLSILSLEDQITHSPEDINAVDAMGRTALAWAAA
ncbi:uncharacterized protein N7479_009488 [Penicillium vulpinum]|uniref:Uncharacterized protein n=1 Tax=Penicillium vulpinum TaxID=29845 RepID=A0A1V6RAQ3_9EURO|nr:uncharacterized protein N7479_009488 [Penicillium vulpinum]KAJ5951075.1 hypothetical protein N7479_009488 [Penicillium vulpinum]OQD98630.1 hypothetical protein PENVUL_c069G05073 [Penicillium vulpinum]